MHAIKAIQGWLRREFGRTFDDCGNTLPHGRQNDSFSCGPGAINTIEHNLFGVEVLSHRTRRLWRLRYFNALVRARNCSQLVSTSESLVHHTSRLTTST